MFTDAVSKLTLLAARSVLGSGEFLVLDLRIFEYLRGGGGVAGEGWILSMTPVPDVPFVSPILGV